MVLKALKVCVDPQDSKSETFELDHDTIAYAAVVIPPGHAGLTGVRVRYGIKCIIPTEPCNYIVGDNLTLEVRGYIRLPEKRPRITVEAYNDDEEFQHCFHIYLDIMDWEDYAWWERMERLMNQFLDRLDAIAARIGAYRPPARPAEKPREARERREVVKPESIIERIRRLLRG